MKRSVKGGIARWIFMLTASASLSFAQEAGARKKFTKSIVPVPPQAGFTVNAIEPNNVALLEDTMEFSLNLKMRDAEQLQRKIAANELIPQSEMERLYLPSASNYNVVVSWLTNQGFTITQTNSQRLSVYAKGTLSQIKKSFEVELVDVTVDHVRYHAAKTAPSLPADVAGPVLGINGLQPFLKARKHAVTLSKSIANRPPYLVNEILRAYNAKNLRSANLALDGSGEMIALLIDAFPNDSDLERFWRKNNLQCSLGQIERKTVFTGPPPSPEGEETLDVEWSSGIAPNARVKIYASGTLDWVNIDKALDEIIEDTRRVPSLHQLSISLGLGEAYMAADEVAAESMRFAALAAAGVSVFVSSGDAGSNPDETGHAPKGPLQAEFQSSDPNVTGVGGTTLTLDPLGVVKEEIAWVDSGGGQSRFFPRPIWQKGKGIARSMFRNDMRLVPDVSLAADPNTGAYFYFAGKETYVGGTSWSAPVWAGFSALINQARLATGKTPLGLLNPRIYPLLGTPAFRDIKCGSNGQYKAAVGYDQVTGIGVPDMALLLTELTK